MMTDIGTPRTTSYDFHSTGNVNSGNGTQINHIHVPLRRRRESRVVADEEIRRLADRFVRPKRFPFDVFTRSSTAVLTGQDGSGRRTTALMLLTDVGKNDVDRLRVLDDRTDDPDNPAFDVEELRPGEPLLLDLCETDEGRVRELQPQLEFYRTAVADKRARLVVVVRPDQVEHLAESLAALVVRFERPDGTAVLRAHLAPDHISLPDPLPAADRLREYLRDSAVGSIAALARLTVEARDTGRGASLTEWLSAALGARLERAAQAAKLFTDQQRASVRALLVVAAFLPGAPLEAMVSAEAVFGGMVKLPREDLHVLDGAHLAERMAQVSLRVDGRRTVEFTDLAMDSALRTHFWTYFPHLRERVEQWVQAVPSLPTMPYQAAADLLDRFAELLLVTGPPEPLMKLARRWTGDDAKRKPELAAQALAIGLRHDRWSKRFRDYVYLRSREHNLPVPFAQVLIAVCVDDIAPNQPPQALVRLHHFTRHNDRSVRSAAHDALIGSVERYGFQRWLLYRLVRGDLRETDRNILLDLVVPSHMANEHHMRRNLLNLWRRLFSVTTHDVPTAKLWEWIGRDPALVVEACGGRAALLNELFVLARTQIRHAEDPGALRTAVESAQTLLRHINTALHIGGSKGQGWTGA
ncbi:hypothetical protein Q5530_33575 [Saccharothrix sp. BKS2]|uniref:hypothetical protein n=1 Tax=Saccharothrix sp. BKS2 TaxID=3064400 RepID=UPI0039EC107C